MLIYTKEDAIENLPEISDIPLLEAVIFAISLYLEQGETLKKSVDESAQLFDIKPKKAVERMVRKAIPENVILSRRRRKKCESHEDRTTHDAFFDSMIERELDLVG